MNDTLFKTGVVLLGICRIAITILFCNAFIQTYGWTSFLTVLPFSIGMSLMFDGLENKIKK